MKIFVLLSVITIPATVFAYFYLQEDVISGQNMTFQQRVTNSFSQKSQDKYDKLINVLQNYQQTNQAQFQKAQLLQAKLHNKLAELDTRLSNMETTAGSHKNETDSFEKENPNTDSEKETTGEVAEADLGHWMDENLQTDDWDSEATKQATDQAHQTLADIPDINLDDMQCNKRFCRASFSHENNDQVDIWQVLGEPPFVREAFTVQGADGNVALYFAQPGASLAELRDEAQEVALEYSN